MSEDNITLLIFGAFLLAFWIIDSRWRGPW
jgi:hypothetical protein